MVKVIVTGCAGRMGREICSSLISREGMELAGGTEVLGHPDKGANLLAMLGERGEGITVSDNLNEVIGDCDVVIDFTSPSASFEHFNIVADNGKAIVMGTTGFTPEQIKGMDERKSEVRCVRAPNMSVGVNVMFKLLAEAVKALGSEYDMEIVEMHHRLKKDAPSGTAARLAQICAEGTGRDLSSVGVYGRQGMVGERKPGEIAIMSLRGGDVVGDHTVIFAGEGERIEITHKCSSRKNFAIGAIRGVEWVVKQKPGIYDMQDVLSL